MSLKYSDISHSSFKQLGSSLPFPAISLLFASPSIHTTIVARSQSHVPGLKRGAHQRTYALPACDAMISILKLFIVLMIISVVTIPVIVIIIIADTILSCLPHKVYSHPEALMLYVEMLAHAHADPSFVTHCADVSLRRAGATRTHASR